MKTDKFLCCIEFGELSLEMLNGALRIIIFLKNQFMLWLFTCLKPVM